MTDDMQGQIEERKTQAAERQIFEKAIHAAYYLGDGHRHRPEHRTGDLETHMVYHDADAGAGLTIDFSSTAEDAPGGSTYNTLLEILEGEETVFLQKGETVEGYVSGDWETELDKLQRPSDRAMEDMARATEQKKQATKSERATALRKAWGLSDKDGRTRGTTDPKPRAGGVMEQPPRRRR